MKRRKQYLLNLIFFNPFNHSTHYLKSAPSLRLAYVYFGFFIHNMWTMSEWGVIGRWKTNVNQQRYYHIDHLHVIYQYDLRCSWVVAIIIALLNTANNVRSHNRIKRINFSGNVINRPWYLFSWGHRLWIVSVMLDESAHKNDCSVLSISKVRGRWEGCIIVTFVGKIAKCWQHGSFQWILGDHKGQLRSSEWKKK